MQASLIFSDYVIDQISLNEVCDTQGRYDQDNLNIRYGAETEFADDDQHGRATLECIICMPNKLEEDAPHEILRVRIRGYFTHDGSLDAEKFHRMTHVNGLTALFPILRGAVATITQMTNLRMAVLLPMVNVVKMLESQNEEAGMCTE